MGVARIHSRSLVITSTKKNIIEIFGLHTVQFQFNINKSGQQNLKKVNN